MPEPEDAADIGLRWTIRSVQSVERAEKTRAGMPSALALSIP